MIGEFTNRSDQKVKIVVGSDNTPLTITSATIDSDSLNNIYKPIQYSSLEFGVLTDDLRCYNGSLFKEHVQVLIDNNLIWEGTIIEFPQDQPFNYEKEVLTFNAVDKLTLLKSDLMSYDNYKGRVSIKDFLIDCFGEFTYIPFITDNHGLLDCDFSYQAYIEDKDSVVYRSEILESVCEYLGVTCCYIGGNIVLRNPRANLFENTAYHVDGQGTIASTTFYGEVKQINHELIAKADVSCDWSPSVNSITLNCDYKELGSTTNSDVDESSIYWLESNYAMSKSWTTPIANDEGEKTTLIGSYLARKQSFPISTTFPPSQYSWQIPNALMRDSGGENIVYGTNYHLGTQDFTIQYFVDPIYKFRDWNLIRRGYSPDVEYYTYFKSCDHIADDARRAYVYGKETASGEHVLDSFIPYLPLEVQGLPQDKLKVLLIEYANYRLFNNVTTPDSMLSSDTCGLFGCCEVSYTSQQDEYVIDELDDNSYPSGSPSFKSSILVFGTNGFTHIGNDCVRQYTWTNESFSHYIPATSKKYKFPLCTRHYDITPTPLVDSSLQTHYVVVNGNVNFFFDNFFKGYSKEYDNTSSFTMGVDLEFLDDEGNVVTTVRKDIQFQVKKDSNIFEPIPTADNVTWQRGINETGFSFEVGDIGHASKMNMTIHPIFYYVHSFEPNDLDASRGVNQLAFNLDGIYGEDSRVTNVVTPDFYVLNLEAKIATGWVESQQEEGELTPTSNLDASNTVYYWLNEDSSLVGADDLDISNKLCTYDGKMSTVSCPTINGEYLNKVNCVGFNGQFVSEVFRFGQLIDQYKSPTIGFSVPIKGKIDNACTLFTYPYVGQGYFAYKGFSYDLVSNETIVDIEELKDLTYVELK